ncbi:MAG: hypothetical protein HC877_24110 [Thioploca sp.]|nr:hypothetical protein [Thioploca sp.]
MSKWRPSGSCIYIIADIHGMFDEFELIMSRILPLRYTGGIEDKLILLGDYIDRRGESHLLIDRLIELKKEYPKQN